MSRTYEMPFEFDVPVSMWLDKSAPVGKQRRIGGIISTESEDRQREIVLQRGLDFSDFLKSGWLNNNHSKETDGILGYPETVHFVRKGAHLSNGTQMPADGHVMEGHLLDTGAASGIWELGQALQKASPSRRLGFSIEGKVVERQGPGNRTIAKARIRNVAITNCPVNTDTRLEVLAKSIESFERSMSMGAQTSNAKTFGVPTTGAGTGPILGKQDLETEAMVQAAIDDHEAHLLRQPKKRLSKSEAVAFLGRRLPNARPETLKLFVDLTLRGLLG